MKTTLAFLTTVIVVVSAVAITSGLPPGVGGFTLDVYPPEISGDAIAGQRVVFLVSFSPAGPGGPSSVRLAAHAPQSTVLVTPEDLARGQVGEVAVIPDVTAVGAAIALTFTARANGVTRTQSVNFSVVEGEDGRAEHARELRVLFVQWLQENAPELHISNQTQWLGTIVSPRWLVVEHYLFFSEEWETHVYWHVMIPPSDWARIDLRERSTGYTPSLSLEISSVSGGTAVHPIPPPEDTWR